MPKDEYRIKLIVDKEGYLTEDPRYVDTDEKVPLAGNSPTKPPTFKDFRVRIVSVQEDPRDQPANPTGCRLIGGVWYCP
jgi:hypothetical protein